MGIALTLPNSLTSSKFTQPKAAKALHLGADKPIRRKFLARLEGEITKRGTIDVLRNGIKHGPASPGSLLWNAVSGQRKGQGPVRAEPVHRHRVNFVTARTRFSGLWIWRSSLTAFQCNHVRVEEQPHQADRERCHPSVPPGPQPPREALRTRSVFGALCGRRHASLLLHPLTGKGFGSSCHSTGDGATEPAILPILNGLAVDYLWREVLSRQSLTNIIENYAQLIGKGSQQSTDLAAVSPTGCGAQAFGERRCSRSRVGAI